VWDKGRFVDVNIASVPSLRIVAGGANVLAEGAALADRATNSLSGEFFVALEQNARTAVGNAWNRGVHGSAVITAHPQSIEQIESLVGANGDHVRIGHFGELAPSTAPRQFIHTKTLARDEKTATPEAWLSTGSFSDDTRWRFEVAGIFGGDAARAVHELADSVASHDFQRQRDALAWAKTLGIYATDPVSEEHGLGEAVHHIVRNEPTHLTVAMKSMFDERFATEIAMRHVRDGIPVDVITKRMDEPSERILRQAGVNVMKPADDVPEIHGNVVHGEGLAHAYWGTLWASPRGFGRSEVPNPFTGGGGTLPRSQWWDRSRELGAVTSDPQGVADLHKALELLKPAPHDFQQEVIRVQGG
jgi:hypothetical protein